MQLLLSCLKNKFVFRLISVRVCVYLFLSKCNMYIVRIEHTRLSEIPSVIGHFYSSFRFVIVKFVRRDKALLSVK